ncbi:Pentatricopeptide repeat-containing protein At1g05750, chloroplastic [Linum perenne]
MAAAALPDVSSTPQLPRRQPEIRPPYQIQPPNLSKSNRSVTYEQSNQHIDPVISWTSSISRHCRNGRLGQAASLFTQMRLSAVEPNHVTFITLLSACADFPAEGRFFGAMIHSYLRKLGLDRNHVVVGTALVKMYAKYGELELARICFDELEVKNLVSWNTMIGGYLRNQDMELAVQLFDEMPQRDAVSWTLLIDGFVKKGLFEEALDSFREMQVSEVEPDYVTITSVLAACANLGALGLGLWTHRYVLHQDFKDNVRIQNSLIDMYARCGCIELSRQVFDKMPKRTLVSWNSIIGGLSTNGYAEEALEYFKKMRKEGFNPDGVTFTGALTACSHAGFVTEGENYFEIMTKEYKISPGIEHYGCLVDLYSRAGELEAAMNVIETMIMKPNEVILGSLLTACKSHKDVELAERVMTRIVDLEPGVDSNYVILANLYAAKGEWEGAGKIRRKMKEVGVRKTPGFSSVEVESKVHEFVAGDRSHCEVEQIYGMLELVMFELKLRGYDSRVSNKEVENM